MVIRPGIQVKPVKCDSLVANWNFGEKGPNFSIESVAVHTEIERRIAQADQPGQ